MQVLGIGRVGRGGASLGLPRAEHAIVVFGTAARPDGTPGPNLLRRLQVALQAARQDPNAVLVVSGGPVANEVTEADAMKRWLMSRGISSDRIVLERKARYTRDNAEKVAPLLKGIGADRVTLVTEQFHMARSRAVMDVILRKTGHRAQLQVLPAPNGPVPSDVNMSEAAKYHRDLQNALGRKMPVKEWLA